MVDRSSHELKAVELKGNDKKASVEISFDINVNKSEEIKVPSSAESLKEFYRRFLWKGIRADYHQPQLGK